ncbi:MAG TPA: hypothetical protein ENI19_01735 [Candidatus Nealsonbacteria bacterium]|uniref:Cytochrome oxidase subunit II copper A binding domain-containing protein n=1 Tax=marine sediment metagenome TaxID=412755 RepID=A0A0F9XMV3_9ZZZZ|nr:hypothetical protein [Candidatus Nealsonbacteria bacterium]HEB46412.1 hypothetical protein [Candidatus Nealsonbacteria bacterium]
MVIRIPIKGLIIFGIIIVVGFWILGKINDNRNINSSVNSPFSQNPSLENVLTGKVREIEVTARQFSFTPDLIRVKLGDNVRLEIESVDVVHGFSLPEFGINEILEPGKTVTIEFQATRRGTFSFLCSIVCGAGHSRMIGTLIVE